MRIHCSTASATLLRTQAPEISLTPRGRIRIKGKQEMSTYWVQHTVAVSRQLPSAPADYTPAPPESAPLEVVTLAELTKRAKATGMKLSDFSNNFGARSLAELLSRVPAPEDIDDTNRSTDFFLQRFQSSDDLAQIEALRQDVAARLGVRIAL